jgi:hypothetical protein
VDVCDDSGAGLALEDYAGHIAQGNAIVMDTSRGTRSQDIVGQPFDYTGQCPNLVVTYDPSKGIYCPFTYHPWDQSYAGDPMAALWFTNLYEGYYGCLGAINNLGVIVGALEPCSSTPANADIWVFSPKTTTGAQVIINVYWTNYFGAAGGHVQVLTGTNTIGDNSRVDNFVNGALQQWVSAGGPICEAPPCTFYP